MVVVKMRDVATHAGVSVSTVSKILSGSAASSQIPLRTIERVRRSALQLGYIPNAVARSLRTQRTREIGIVLGMETYPEAAALTLDGTFLLGLINAAAVCHLPGLVVYPREENSVISDVSRYLDGRIEGLLVRSSTPHQEEQLLSLLAESPLPVVAIWTQEVPDVVGYVDVDHRAGSYQAVQYLLKLGTDVLPMWNHLQCLSIHIFWPVIKAIKRRLSMSRLRRVLSGMSLASNGKRSRHYCACQSQSRRSSLQMMSLPVR